MSTSKGSTYVLAALLLVVIISESYLFLRLLHSKLPRQDTTVFLQTNNNFWKPSYKPKALETPQLVLEAEEPNRSNKLTESREMRKSAQTQPTKYKTFSRSELQRNMKSVNPVKSEKAKFLSPPKKYMMASAKPVQYFGPEVLVENDKTLKPRELNDYEKAGNNILFSLRSTMKFHKKRLPIVFETWMTKANLSNIFLVTDGEDEDWKGRDGLNYVNVPCSASYERDDLCCKAGTELSLMFREENMQYDWLCHMDDDIYVLLDPLVKQLSKFDPRNEAVYFGRSGSAWNKPRKVMYGARYGKAGQLYHFAVGGMYCLSRAMLELSRPYLVGGKNFATSCAKTLEPEDVTVGVVVGVVLNKTLSRTEMIYTHGLSLETESFWIQNTLDQQICYSYGYGAIMWGGPGGRNHIIVPNALFTYEQDVSRWGCILQFYYKKRYNHTKCRYIWTEFPKTLPLSL